MGKKRITTKLLVSFLLGFTILFSPVDIKFANEVQEEKSVDILLTEAAPVEELQQQVLENDPTAEFSWLAEIQLLRVYYSLDELPETIETANNEAVEQIGQLGDMLPEAVFLKEQANYQSAMLPESLSPLTPEGELLQELSWNVARVTDNRASLDISQGTGVRIGLIDSGVDVVHPELVDNIDLTYARSYVTDEGGVTDTQGHGTMVAGIIAQTAPLAKITPYRVLGSSSGDSLWTIEAIVQSANDQQDVVNLSLGTYKCENEASEALTVQAFQRAVDYANQSGTTLVASAGNQGRDLDAYYETEGIRHLPGSVSGVLAITSSTRAQQFASYSNFGSHVSFGAPGGDYYDLDGNLNLDEWIYGLHPTTMDNGLGVLGVPQGYNFSVGTSLSAPLATGVIAQITAHYERMTGITPSKDEVLSLLQAGAVDLSTAGWDTLFGYGEVNAAGSLANIIDTIAPTAEFIPATVEFGEPIKAEDLVGSIQDNYDKEFIIAYDVEPNTTVLGAAQASVSISDQGGNTTLISGELQVVDTQAPIGDLVDGYWIYAGEEVDPAKLVTNISDNVSAEGVVIDIVSENDWNKLGNQEVTIHLTDQSGNQTVLAGTVAVKGRPVVPTADEEPPVVEEVTQEKSPVISDANGTQIKKMNTQKNPSASNNIGGKLPHTADSQGYVVAIFGVQVILMAIYLFVTRRKKE